MRIFHPGLLLAIVATSSSAASLDVRASRTTSIANKACRFDAIGAAAGDDESQTKRCPGLVNSRVVVTAAGTRVSLGFEWPHARPRAPFAAHIAVGWSLGETLEWRGNLYQGFFKPDSAIVRLLFNKDGSRTIERQVLAVMQVQTGSACLIGVIDMSADRMPYETAHRLADSKAKSFVCGKDSASVAGSASEWTGRALALSAQGGD